MRHGGSHQRPQANAIALHAGGQNQAVEFGVATDDGQAVFSGGANAGKGANHALARQWRVDVNGLAQNGRHRADVGLPVQHASLAAAAQQELAGAQRVNHQGHGALLGGGCVLGSQVAGRHQRPRQRRVAKGGAIGHDQLALARNHHLVQADKGHRINAGGQHHHVGQDAPGGRLDADHALVGRDQLKHRRLPQRHHVGAGQQAVCHLVADGMAVPGHLESGQHTAAQARHAAHQHGAVEPQRGFALVVEVALLRRDHRHLLLGAGKQIGGAGVKQVGQHLLAHQLGVKVARLARQLHHHAGAFAGHRHRTIRGTSGAR